MKILSLSDTVVSFIYSPQVRQRFQGIDIIFGCGDLAYYYLEYVCNALDAPLYYVRGNHDKVVEYGANLQRTQPEGGIDLHRRVVHHHGLLFAGVEGSLRYRPGRYQYSQREMWNHVLSMVPALLINRLRYGRSLDIFISHAPAQGIHDMDDLPHQGIKAFRWLLRVFRPAYHFHGHVHRYRPDMVDCSQFGRTQVINTYGFYETTLVEIST